MCVLFLARGEKTILGFSRDEYFQRQTNGPEVKNGITAPTDLIRGGTWLASNQNGLIVGILNNERTWDSNIVVEDKLSRGALVRQLAELPTNEAFEEALENIDFELYNPLYLFWIYDNKFSFLESSGKNFYGEEMKVDDKFLCMTNIGLLPMSEEAPEIKSVIEMDQLLTSHHPVHQICKHGKEWGTVSSSILVVDEGKIKWYYRSKEADKPNCMSSMFSV